MTWWQPVAGLDGALTMTQMSHPCVNGCSGWFKIPAAELGNVVNPRPGDGPDTGNVARANLHHRTDWSRPPVPVQIHSLEPPN